MATITGGGGSDLRNDTIGTSDYYLMLGGNDSVFAGGGNDTVFGGSGSDRLFGGADNDILYGGSNNDSLFGGTGNDTLLGGSGNDNLVGGAGFDFVSYADFSGDVTVNLASGTGSGDGTDAISEIEGAIGGSGNDNITGNSDANWLIGGAGNDSLFGGAGNDTIEGGLGNDLLSGGDGTDTLSYANAANAVNVNLNLTTVTSQGTDTISGFENVTGSMFADTLTGDGGANVITGGTGNDIIDGGAGNDTIFAGPEAGTAAATTPVDLDFNWSLAGSDETSLSGGVTQDTGGISVGVTYDAGQAGATFSVESSGSTAGTEREFPIYVGSGETFDPNSSAELYRDGGSASVSSVRFDFSSVDGSGYADEVTNVRFRISDIDLAGFTDTVTVRAYDADGNEISVTITETSAGLSVSGNTVTATGGAVNPNSVAGSALFEIAGPVSYFVVSYSDLNGAPQAIRVSDVQFQAIPVIDNDSVVGGAGNDVIFGGSGNDTIDGGADDDSLFGGSGNDVLTGGTGADVIDGGDGNDSLLGGDGADSISGGAGNDTILFGSGDDTVFGGDGNDLIDDVGGTSLAGANLVYGGEGNDTIWAGDDADSIFGDAGDDLLFGEGGNDLIFGGNGDDDIFGGIGADTLSGGAGADAIFGGDDQDSISMAFADAFGSEVVDGGSGGVDDDTLTIDITGFGWTRIDLVFDPLNGENGTVTFYNPDMSVLSTLTFTDIENLVIVCFTPGTMIATDQGEVAVEALSAGDLVLTRDHGLQPLRWVGQRQLSFVDMMVNPELQPVRIDCGALGAQAPERAMMVSPQHRVLIDGARAELLFGETEVLVAARHLLGSAGVSRVVPSEGLTYIHLLFDQHEIVQSDGIWTESFQPAARTLSSLDAAVLNEVLTLFPSLASDADAFVAARRSLKAHEAAVLLSA